MIQRVARLTARILFLHPEPYLSFLLPALFFLLIFLFVGFPSQIHSFFFSFLGPFFSFLLVSTNISCLFRSVFLSLLSLGCLLSLCFSTSFSFLIFSAMFFFFHIYVFSSSSPLPRTSASLTRRSSNHEDRRLSIFISTLFFYFLSFFSFPCFHSASILFFFCFIFGRRPFLLRICYLLFSFLFLVDFLGICSFFFFWRIFHFFSFLFFLFRLSCLHTRGD